MENPSSSFDWQSAGKVVGAIAGVWIIGSTIVDLVKPKFSQNCDEVAQALLRNSYSRGIKNNQDYLKSAVTKNGRIVTIYNIDNEGKIRKEEDIEDTSTKEEDDNKPIMKSEEGIACKIRAQTVNLTRETLEKYISEGYGGSWLPGTKYRVTETKDTIEWIQTF